MLFRLLFGALPHADQHICHSCDVRVPPGDKSYRRCVNPAHLWLGSNRDNTNDRIAKGRDNPKPRYGDRNGSRTQIAKRPRGMGHKSTKFGFEVMEEIRHRAQAGEPMLAISRSLGVSNSHARRVAAGIVRKAE